MSARHRWVWHHDVTLVVRNGAREDLISGREFECSNGCPVRKRETDAGHSRVISRNRGATWGPFGEPLPPCEGRP